MGRLSASASPFSFWEARAVPMLVNNVLVFMAPLQRDLCPFCLNLFSSLASYVKLHQQNYILKKQHSPLSDPVTLSGRWMELSVATYLHLTVRLIVHQGRSLLSRFFTEASN